MYPELKKYCDELKDEFHVIPQDRRHLLESLTAFILKKTHAGEPVRLIYVCTHNSRRSQFGQVWSALAAVYYDIPEVRTFSGGTVATEFNSHAISALKRAGFQITGANDKKNPPYQVFFSDDQKPLLCFSKRFDDEYNPHEQFAAIMTCSDADQNCPFIPGATARISTPYDDPGIFDGKPLQEEKYDACCRLIALETFYAFSLLTG